MMNFKVAKDALLSILDTAAAGRYQLIGFQRQEKSSEEFTGNNRLVEVFFRSEDFLESKGSINGPINAEVTLAIELTVSAYAQGDLSVLNAENPSSADLMAALAAVKEAAHEADDSFDALAEIIYQIVMDGRNLDLGLPVGTISNRWVSSIRKDDTNERGGAITLTGLLEFKCRVCETVVGDTGTPYQSIDIVTQNNDDEITQTGIIAEA